MTIKDTWDHAIQDGAKACKKDMNSPKCITGTDIMQNVVLSGFFFYLYNELAFMFLSEVGPVTSSVMNTAKRVIVIVACAIIFGEPMDRNTKLGATIAVSGVFLYSLAEEADKKAKAAAAKAEGAN